MADVCEKCKGVFRGGSSKEHRIYPQGAITVRHRSFTCDECSECPTCRDKGFFIITGDLEVTCPNCGVKTL